MEPRVSLNAKELSILKELANGWQSKEIAKHIGLKPPTVEQYVIRLRIKFNAHSRAHLVICALLAGVIQAEDVERSLPFNA